MKAKQYFASMAQRDAMQGRRVMVWQMRHWGWPDWAAVAYALAHIAQRAPSRTDCA